MPPHHRTRPHVEHQQRHGPLHESQLVLRNQMNKRAIQPLAYDDLQGSSHLY